MAFSYHPGRHHILSVGTGSLSKIPVYYILQLPAHPVVLTKQRHYLPEWVFVSVHTSFYPQFCSHITVEKELCTRDRITRLYPCELRTEASYVNKPFDRPDFFCVYRGTSIPYSYIGGFSLLY